MLNYLKEFAFNSDKLVSERRDKIFQSLAINGLVSEYAQIASGNRPLASAEIFNGELNDTPSRGISVVIVGGEKTKGIYSTTTEPIPGYMRRDVHYSIGNYESYFPQERDETVEDTCIRYGLYDGNASVFPVIIERNYEEMNDSYSKPIKTLNDRMQNSILIVCRSSELTIRSMGAIDWELVAESPVLTDKFLVILTPHRFKNQLRKHFPRSKLPIFGVGNRKAMLFPNESNSISDNIQVTVPDYEKQIRKLIRKNKSPLLIHGVRLPTHEDIFQ